MNTTKFPAFQYHIEKIYQQTVEKSFTRKKKWRKQNIMKVHHFVIIAVCILISTDSFADFNLYGSVRVGTFYTDTTDNPDERDSNETIWELQNNSRIGGILEKDELTGGFELGNGFDGVEIRKLYGIIKLSEKFKLKIGKDFTPLNYFPSNQVGPGYEYQGGNQGDIGLKPFGGIYEGFQTMIQISTDNLKIALIEPVTVEEESLKFGIDADIEKIAPKVEASYHIGNQEIYIDMYTGYQTYRLLENTTTVEHDINSYVFGINYGLNVGPTYILGNVYSGQNINPYGLWAEGDDSPRIISSEVMDCTTLGYIITFGLKLPGNGVVEAGAGFITHDVKGAIEDDETMSMYINYQYSFRPYFQIVPEIGMIDYRTNNAGGDEGEKLYAGIKWQIDF